MTSEDRRPETERSDTDGPVGNMENAVTGVIAATGDLARMTIDEVSAVGEDLVHAVGRVGVATVSEIMNIVGSITGGIGSATGSMMGRRSRRDQQRRRHEATGEEGSTAYQSQEA